MQPTTQPLEKIVTVASLMTGRNPEVTAAMAPAERTRVVVEAAMLSALALLIFGQWFSLLSGGSLLLAIAGATVFTILLIGFDFVVGSSLERIFAQGQANTSRYWIIAARVSMSAICALILSTASATKLFAPQIDMQNRRDVAMANAPLRAEFESKVARARRDQQTPIEVELTDKMMMRDKAVQRADAMLAATNEATKTAGAQVRESLRQQEGVLGAARGEGPLYRFALAQKEMADADAAKSEKAAVGERAYIAALSRDIDGLRTKQASAARELATREQQLARQMEDDPRYLTIGTDFLSRLVGLIQLMHQPQTGLPVALTIIGLLLMFVGLEVVYLMAKTNVQGMTYAPRDAMRENRDMEAWARHIIGQISRFADPSAGSQPGPQRSDGKIVPLRPPKEGQSPGGE